MVVLALAVVMSIPVCRLGSCWEDMVARQVVGARSILGSRVFQLVFCGLNVNLQEGTTALIQWCSGEYQDCCRPGHHRGGETVSCCPRAGSQWTLSRPNKGIY